MLAKNHYDDCPYGCNIKGMLLDVDTKQMIPCPYCSKKKKELLKLGYVETETDERVPLSTVLGIENDYLSTTFVYDSVIPDGERLFIEEESLSWQGDVATNLYLGLTTGTLPEESMCFGVSIKGRVERFAYPMLAKAYLAGLTVGKFITCSEFSRLNLGSENLIKEFFTPDFLMMMINDGCTVQDIAAAKGLMQTRALKGKPTIFVSTWTIEACSALLGFSDDKSFLMATPVFVKYKKSKGGKEHSSYINGILGVDNSFVNKGNNVSMGDLMGM